MNTPIFTNKNSYDTISNAGGAYKWDADGVSLGHIDGLLLAIVLATPEFGACRRILLGLWRGGLARC